MLSAAVHQLRTPLTRNKWAFDLLMNDQSAALSGADKEMIRKMQQDNEEAIGMVNEILRADYENAAVSFVNKVKVNIGEIIEKTVHDVQRDALSRNISLTFDKTSSDGVQVLVDPQKMVYVFENILLNAIHYTPQGGSVTVQVHVTESVAQVSVVDNGIGIPEAEKGQIFEKFYRATNARAVETEGTGLGLYIAKQIVEKNGGSIAFESVENKGTTFSLSLPLVSVV